MGMVALRYPRGYTSEQLFPTSGGSTMCSPARCGQCGKITWSGCGEHVDEVMAQVPVEGRCTCR